ncbi:MAG TPA: peptidoglycan DD-metalloendopeptidase family protein [Chloroflexota bacterium]|nr:peptidoglycan DD-metalloendopeptidase family protein [Chloroflexota bacterium]
MAEKYGILSRRAGRRAVLIAGAGAAGALTACATVPNAAPVESRPAVAELSAPVTVSVAPAPQPVVVAPAPPPLPSVNDLAIEGIVQPFWTAEGDRILYYDQPQVGLGGTWAVDPASGKAVRERPQWGSYLARGTLLVIPRPTQRDTHITHLPSGREWTLATTNGGLFSPDGTLVTYGAAAQTQGSFGGPGTFQTTTLMVAGADGQNAQRVALPINASAQAWVAGRDGSANGRLLLTGRRARREHTSFWLLDVRTRGLEEIGVSNRRLNGIHVSPDASWVAFLGMWNPDANQDGLWVMRTDGSDRRRLAVQGGYRWTADNRLIVIPMRPTAGESHEVWEANPASGELRRLTSAAETPLRLANYDWDISADGTNLVFVDAMTRRLTNLHLPVGMVPASGVSPAGIPAPGPASGGKPYRMPFATAPSTSGWYIAHWYGVTTGGYRGRNSVYSQGQGIHFGIDFPAPMGTPVVAMAPGRVVAIDGDYGSPPHNVVVQMTDGNQAMYGHLLEPSRHVRVGQTVDPGDVVGNTGDSSNPYDGFGNPHLHLEIRKRGRDTATNPVPYFDANWDDLSLGLYPGPRFERDLDNPRRYQFIDEQPDIRFGGAIITNFARPWPV